MAYKNKRDQAKATHAHYLRNKPKIKARAAKHKRSAVLRNTQHLWDYLKEHPCVDCGEKDPRVLQFDHTRGRKVASLAVAAHGPWSISRLDSEIAKCDIRCANCHLRKTGIERNWYKNIDI